MQLRNATEADVPELSALIERSVRELQRDDYSARQIDLALQSVYGVDTTLIRDGTYFVVTDAGAVVGCGGWSRRKTLFGGDVWTEREDELLDPRIDAAKIRAFFVHPGHARRGIGTMLLAACERAALAAGFRRLEMGATITGVALYETRGYTRAADLEVPLPGGEVLPVVRMVKTMSPALQTMSHESYDVLNPKCPTQQVLDRVASKWTMLVILALGEETLRYSELRARLPGVTQKMLTQTLRALERDGIVRRRVYDSVPIKTEYALSPLGRSLAQAVDRIRTWAYENMESIAEARETFDTAAAHTNETAT